MRPLIVMVFSAISTTHGAAAASSSDLSTMGTLDGEGIVIDCSHPNILISAPCDGESSSVHVDQMGGTQKRATLVSGNGLK